MAAESHPERHDGPTPAGGVASVAYFRDARGQACPRDRAASVEVVELDAAGTEIARTYGRMSPATGGD